MMEMLFAHPESSVMFALAIVALVLVSILKEDFFRPSTLYFLVQMVMLGVSYLQFLPMMSDFNYSTWLVWGGGMFCFLVGCFVTDFAWKSSGGPPLQKSLRFMASTTGSAISFSVSRRLRISLWACSA